jgi:hypothetical protein
MLKNFDAFYENILIEGRKSDDKKKFKINVDKVKKCCNEIGEKHHHYRNDKPHFLDIAEELNPNTVYTPKTFMEHVKSIMKGFGKPTIADGYSKLMYSFLKDRVDSPFEDHDKDSEEDEKEESSENTEEHDELFPNVEEETSEDEQKA